MTSAVQSDRLEALETKFAHLERSIQELSLVLYRQQREMEAMDERHRRLLSQIDSIGTEGADPTRIEIPPHY